METDENINHMTLLCETIHENIRLGGDCMVFVCGKTGTGKSRFFMLNFLDKWYKNILKKDNIPDYAITGDVADYIQSVEKAEKYHAIACDEASDQFSTDNRSDPATRALYHMYQQTREEGLLHVLVMPSFFDLLPAIRDSDVIKFLVYTHTRTPNKCKACKKSFVEKLCPFCGSEKYTMGFCHYKVYDQHALDRIRERGRSLKTKRFEVACKGVYPLIDSTTIPYTGSASEFYNQIKKAKMDSAKHKANALVQAVKKKEGGLRCPQCASLNINTNKLRETNCRRCGHTWVIKNISSPGEGDYKHKSGGKK